MSEVTASLSECLRAIQNAMPIHCELYKLDKEKSASISLSFSEIGSAKRTGGYFSVKTSVLAEIQVSIAESDPELKATEIAVAVVELVDKETFGLSAKQAESLQGVPGGTVERFATWLVSWDQEFYVERFDFTAS